MEIVPEFSRSLFDSAGSRQGPISNEQNTIKGEYTPPTIVHPKITVALQKSGQPSSANNKENQVSNFTSVKYNTPLSLKLSAGIPHRLITSGDIGTPLLKEQFQKDRKTPLFSDEEFNRKSLFMARKEANERNAEAGRPLEYDLDYHPPVYNPSTGVVSPGKQKKIY